MLNDWFEIRELWFGTTVVHQLNQGTHRKLGCHKFPGPFLGTFLGKQKGTLHVFDALQSGESFNSKQTYLNTFHKKQFLSGKSLQKKQTSCVSF